MGMHIEPDTIRAEIARLDRDASVLRNRAQISADTRDRINALMTESAALAADLPQTRAARAHLHAQTNAHRARFARGHALYLEKQAPALAIARQALRDLCTCALPGALDTDITNLIAGFDRHCSQMSTFTPSQGIPAAMVRLLPLRDQ